jgi:uncharacterized protein (DUF4213/DUF364 family)
MKIWNEIKETIQDKNFWQERVQGVSVGIYMTAVLNNSVGVAYTLRGQDPIPHRNPEVKAAGDLKGKTNEYLVNLLSSKSSLERSIGAATINSYLNRKKDIFIEGDPLLYLKQQFSGKKVVMVGYFPFAEEIRSWAGEFTILELNPPADHKPWVKEFHSYKSLLTEADCSIITGVTLLNGTFLEVISLAKDSFVLMLGPTVPLSEVLFSYGVDLITSLWVEDKEKLFTSVMEAAIVPRYKGGKVINFTPHRLVLPAGDFRQRIGGKK